MEPVELATGLVVPSTHGPVVEQVGRGVGRQVVRRLVDTVGEQELLTALPDLAEAPGWAAYAVFADRDAVAVALLHLAGPAPSYEGEVVAPTAPPGSREALLVRALHDAHAAGVRVVGVPRPRLDLRAWPRARDR